MNKNKYSNLIIALFLVIASVAFRYIFSEKDLGGYSFDTGSFALATQNYSIADDRPHLPGYYFHIKEIQFISYFTGDAVSAMVWTSILYSALSAGILFLLLIKYFSKLESSLIAILVATNPFISFFASVGEVYSADLFFSVLILYLGLNKKLIYAMPIAWALATGVRQSTGPLLLPLYTYLMYLDIKSDKTRVKYHLISHLAGLGIILSWFVPMMQSAGGIAAYMDLYRTNSPIGTIKIVPSWARFGAYFFWLMPSLLFIFIARIFNKKSESMAKINLPKEYINALRFWVIPIIIFFLCGNYSKGYMMINAAGIILMAYNLILNHKYKTAITLGLIALNIGVFAFSPHNTPALTSIFSPKYRAESSVRVGIERTFSSFSCSAKGLRKIESYYKNIDDLIKSSPDLSKKYCFVDPTSPIPVRNLQFLYPNIRFYVMLTSDSGLALEYYNNTQISKNFFDMLDSSLILTRTDYLEQYLKPEFKLEYKSVGGISLAKIDSSNALRLANKYSQMFLK